MTTEHEATRTLVKSPPELWAECSDAASLARHLGEFGEIKITRLEPETAIAWEGERVSGTVRIEPSAWGTRVTLTAHMTVDEVEEPAQVTGEHAVESGEDVVAEQTVVVDEPVVVEERVVADDAPAVAKEHFAVADTPLGQTSVTPARKLGLMARIRAYFERGRLAEAPTVVQSPGFERSSEPPPVAVVPVAPESESAEPNSAPGTVTAAVAPEPEQESEIPPAVAQEPEPETAPAPSAPAPSAPEPEPASRDPESASPPRQPGPEAVLTAALESLGQAHHRPFSRA